MLPSTCGQDSTTDEPGPFVVSSRCCLSFLGPTNACTALRVVQEHLRYLHPCNSSKGASVILKPTPLAFVPAQLPQDSGVAGVSSAKILASGARAAHRAEASTHLSRAARFLFTNGLSCGSPPLEPLLVTPNPVIHGARLPSRRRNRPNNCAASLESHPIADHSSNPVTHDVRHPFVGPLC